MVAATYFHELLGWGQLMAQQWLRVFLIETCNLQEPKHLPTKTTLLVILELFLQVPLKRHIVVVFHGDLDTILVFTQ